MLSLLKNRLGIPGLISVIALVFAMSGGAYAAKDVIGGEATSSAKAKKGPRGKRGPAGPAGPVGPVGPAGPKGDAGAAGSAGKDGTSVTSTQFAGAKGGCTAGGAEFASASAPTFACNGKQGPPGDEGSPWTAGGTLPEGATETGTWFLTSESPLLGGFAYFTAISFPIPLAAGLSEDKVKYVKTPDTVPDECNDGEDEAPSYVNPEADPGFLCVFRNHESLLTTNPEVLIVGTSFGSSLGTDATGAFLATTENPGVGVAGSFAVTGAPPSP